MTAPAAGCYAPVLVGDLTDDRAFRRAANRAASGRWAAGRRSLLDLNARHRISGIDAGVLARPSMAFAFVLRDLAGWLIGGGVNDEAERRRHALRDGRVADQRQHGKKNGFRSFAHDEVPHEILLNTTACRRRCRP